MYYVYILTNKSTKVLYTGVTNNIQRRIFEHKNNIIRDFTSKYNVHKLVFIEEFSTSLEALAAEKKIKGWVRKKKNELISKANPEWNDLSLQ